MEDAALKLVGTKAVAQCQWWVWRSSKPNYDPYHIQNPPPKHSTFTFTALLPRSDAELISLSNHGQFISVDQRPVSSIRGVIKQVVRLIRIYLASSRQGKKPTPTADILLCMNISCPVGSYDVNIEPAKDDVLFTDVGHFLEVCESFLKYVYGNLQEKTTETKPVGGETDQLHVPVQFQEGLDRDAENSADDAVTPPHIGIDSSPAESPRKCSRIGKHFLSPEIPLMPFSAILNSSSPCGRPSNARLSISKPPQLPYTKATLINAGLRDDREMHDAAAEEQAGNPSTGSWNPWTIAKMNTALYSKPVHERQTAVQSYGNLMTPTKQLGDLSGENTPSLPLFKMQNSKSANRRFSLQSTSEASPPQISRSPVAVNDKQLLNQWTPINRARSTRSGGTPLSQIPTATGPLRTKKPDPNWTNFSCPPISDPRQSLLSDQLPSSNYLQKPASIQPLQRVVEDASLSFLNLPRSSQTILTAAPSLRTVSAENIESAHQCSQPGQVQPQDLQEQTPNGQCRTVSTSPNAGSPLQLPSLLPTDPRHYLLSLQHGDSGGSTTTTTTTTTAPPRFPPLTRLRRRETAMLPFETVDMAQKLYALRLEISSVCEADIRLMVDRMGAYDGYIRTGRETAGMGLAASGGGSSVAKEFEDVVSELISKLRSEGKKETSKKKF